MAGIYIHIPFCKQACSYCNFHFSTSLRRKNELVAALLSELELRRAYLQDEPVETIYFGGGTPSLLRPADIQQQIEKIVSLYDIRSDSEITIETNPDDITDEKLMAWRKMGINRLSIGIQSFFEDDLRWMNRAHSSAQAAASVELARNYFENISADLIYGLPSLTNEKWNHNIDKITSFNIPHLSCYALTVEPKTPLHKMISKGVSEDIDPDRQSEQFLILMQRMSELGYEHYEISNFSKPGFRSGHNSSYWKMQKYLGIGPSAHSYNGVERQWNTANNNVYIDSISKGVIPSEKEVLTPVQKLNEHIMTSLRTIEGLDLNSVEQLVAIELKTGSKKYIERGLVIEEENHLKLTREGKLFADGIAADLFLTKTVLPSRSSAAI